MNGSVNASSSESEVDPALYDVPPSVVALLSCFYGLISLSAAVGNALVIYVVAVAPRMRTVTNFYIANLAFADVTIALFAIPFQFHAALLQRWDLPEFMCQFCPTVQLFSVNISIFTLVAISLDRYRAIMHPLRRKPSKLFSQAVIVLIWAASLAFALPMGLAHTFGYVPDDNRASSSNSSEEVVTKPFCYIDLGTNATNTTLIAFKSYMVSLVTVEYFVPLSVISFAYARIAFRLWGSKTPGAAQNERDHNILLNKKKVIKMLMVVVLIFATCWLPWQTYMTVTLIAPQINEYRYINIIFFFCHWLAMSNSCYNPIIYGIYSEKFRREFSVRLPCLRPLLGRPSAGGGGDTNGATATGNPPGSNCVMHTNHTFGGVSTTSAGPSPTAAVASPAVAVYRDGVAFVGAGHRYAGKYLSPCAMAPQLSRSTTALNEYSRCNGANGSSSNGGGRRNNNRCSKTSGDGLKLSTGDLHLLNPAMTASSPTGDGRRALVMSVSAAPASANTNGEATRERKQTTGGDGEAAAEDGERVALLRGEAEKEEEEARQRSD